MQFDTLSSTYSILSIKPYGIYKANKLYKGNMECIVGETKTSSWPSRSMWPFRFNGLQYIKIKNINKLTNYFNGFRINIY